MSLTLFSLLCSLTFAALLGHYKLWDSSGNALYDYSGNKRHAVMELNGGLSPIQTDRGQYLQSKTSIKFPTNSYSSNPGSSTMIVSFWFLAVAQGNLFNISLGNSGASKTIELGWKPSNDGVSGVIYYRNGSNITLSSSLTYSKIYLRRMESYDI